MNTQTTYKNCREKHTFIKSQKAIYCLYIDLKCIAIENEI